jgi:hypothetical protein
MALSHLGEAERLAEAAEMNDAVAAARYRRGLILGGTDGRALADKALAELSSLGVKRPERMMDVIAPGFGNSRG